MPVKQHIAPFFRHEEEFEADLYAVAAMGCYQCAEELADMQDWQTSLDDPSSDGYLDRKGYLDCAEVLQEQNRLCEHHALEEIRLKKMYKKEQDMVAKFLYAMGLSEKKAE